MVRRPCILVVHDEPAIRRLIVGLLAHAGYEVATVDNGEEGVQALGRSRRWFDLVIVNVFHPCLSGAQAVASVHRHFPGRPNLNMDELSNGRFSADRLLHAVRELTGPGPLRDQRSQNSGGQHEVRSRARAAGNGGGGLCQEPRVRGDGGVADERHHADARRHPHPRHHHDSQGHDEAERHHTPHPGQRARLDAEVGEEADDRRL
jgi:CheY-like chemotaxis protein